MKALIQYTTVPLRIYSVPTWPHDPFVTTNISGLVMFKVAIGRRSSGYRMHASWDCSTMQMTSISICLGRIRGESGALMEPAYYWANTVLGCP